MLAVGDPFVDENFGVTSILGGSTALLQQVTGPGLFSTLATGMLVGANELQGDYNADGVVDAVDYTVWRNSLGQTTGAALAADGDGNRIVDGDDYLFWKNNYGAPEELPTDLPPALLSVQAPEPGSLLLAIGSVLAICAVGRMRR
jgi:hypothetical protein